MWVEVQELDIFILVNVEALKKYTAFQYINIMSSLAWITVMHVKKNPVNFKGKNSIYRKKGYSLGIKK